MAQLERRKKLSESPKSPKCETSPTFEQLLRVEEAYWSSNASPSGRVCHDHEVCPSHCPSQTKKSVLSKVKETAKKLKYSLSGRRRHGIELHDDHNLDHHHDPDPNPNPNPNPNHLHNHLDHHNDHITPSWGTTFEDDYDHEHDEDPEYLGAPMYESEAAPECLKETARQHPRAEPVVSESHRAPVMTKHETATSMITNTTQAVADKLAPACAAVSDAAHNMHTTDMIKNTTQTVADKLAPACAAVSDAAHNMHTTEMITNTTQTVADKLAPACAVVSDATHQIASKIAGIAVTSPETRQETSRYSGEIIAAFPRQEAKAELMSEGAGNLKQCAGGSPQTYDKGVSVKEYFLNKLEPGEDERALSQAITEAISPRKSTGETGVVDKVKEAVTSFFRQEEASNSTEKPADSISADPAASSEVETIAELNRATSIHADKTASPSSAALDAAISPTVVQLKRVAEIHAEKPASPSSAFTDTLSIQTNAPQPQLNRIASVHVHSTKVYADNATSSPLIPVSTNAHEVYEEENHGSILQTN